MADLEPDSAFFVFSVKHSVSESIPKTEVSVLLTVHAGSQSMQSSIASICFSVQRAGWSLLSVRRCIASERTCTTYTGVSTYTCTPLRTRAKAFLHTTLGSLPKIPYVRHFPPVHSAHSTPCPSTSHQDLCAHSCFRFLSLLSDVQITDT